VNRAVSLHDGSSDAIGPGSRHRTGVAGVRAAADTSAASPALIVITSAESNKDAADA
jgi:hypothetical protein